MIWVHLLLFLSFSDFKNSRAAAVNEIPFGSISTYSPPLDGEYRNQDEFCPVKDLPNNIHFSNKCDKPVYNGVSTENQQDYYQTNNNINPNGNRPVQMFPRQRTVKSDISNAVANFAPTSCDFYNTKDTKSSPDLNIKGSLVPFSDNSELGLCNTILPFKPNFQILKSDIDIMPFNNPSNIYLRSDDCVTNVDKKYSVCSINKFSAIDGHDFKTIKGNLIPVSSNTEINSSPLLHMSNMKPHFQILKTGFNMLPNKASAMYCNKPSLNYISRESTIPPSLKNKISSCYPVSSGKEFKVPISVTCTTFSPKTVPLLNREIPTEKFSVIEGCNNLRNAIKPSFQIDNSCLCRDNCEKSADLSIKGHLIPVSSSLELQNSCFSSPLSNIKPDFQILNSDIDVIPTKKSSSTYCFNKPQSRFISYGNPISSCPGLNNRVSTSCSTCAATDFKVPISLTCPNFTPKTDMSPINSEIPTKSCLINCNKPTDTADCNSLKISSSINNMNSQKQSSQKGHFGNEKCNLNEENFIKNSSPRKPFIIDCTRFLNNIHDEETITAKKHYPLKVSNTITPTPRTPNAVTEFKVYEPDDCNNISPNIFANQQITENVLNLKPCIENKKPVFRQPLEISYIGSDPVNIPQPFTSIIDYFNINKPDVNQCSLKTETIFKDFTPQIALLDFNPETISVSEPISFTTTFIPNAEINSCLSPVNQIVDNQVKIDNVALIKVAPPSVPLNAFPNIYANNIDIQNLNPIPSSGNYDFNPKDIIYNLNSHTPPNLNSYFTNEIQNLNPVKVPITINVIPSNYVQQSFDVYESQYPSYQYKTQELPEVCVNQFTDYLPVGSFNYVEPLTSYNSNYVLPVVKILPAVSYIPPTVFKTSIVSNDCVNNDFISKINSLVSQILSQRSQRLKTNKITSKPDSECISSLNTFSPDSAKPLILPISSYIEDNPIQYLPECNVPTKSFNFSSLPSTNAPSTPKFSSCKSLQKLLQVIALSELINCDSSMYWEELGSLIYAACN